MRLLFALFIWTLLVSTAQAQSTEPLVTDRPCQAMAAGTVGAGALQIQTGTNVQGERLPAFTTSYLASELVLRYGLGDRFEVNGLLAHQTPAANNFISNLNGVSACQLGIRFGIFEGKGVLPALAFQYSLKLRTVSDVFRAPITTSRFMLASSQPLTDWLTLSTNLGMEWDGYGNPPQAAYVLNLAAPLGPQLSLLVENYGNFGDGFVTYFDAGLAYLVNNDLQLDLAFGGGYNDDLLNYFAGLGVSWRIIP